MIINLSRMFSKTVHPSRKNTNRKTSNFQISAKRLIPLPGVCPVYRIQVKTGSIKKNDFCLCLDIPRFLDLTDFTSISDIHQVLKGF
jgi:hypothetical protein